MKNYNEIQCKLQNSLDMLEVLKLYAPNGADKIDYCIENIQEAKSLIQYQDLAEDCIIYDNHPV